MSILPYGTLAIKDERNPSFYARRGKRETIGAGKYGFHCALYAGRWILTIKF